MRLRLALLAICSLPLFGIGGTSFRPPDIASADFEDGTPGPFSIVGPITFVEDSTVSRAGRLARMHYADTTTPTIIRTALTFRPKTAMGFRSTVYFGGDVYIPPGTYNMDNPNVDRPLLTFRATGFSLAPQPANATDKPKPPDLTVILHVFGCGMIFHYSENHAGTACDGGAFEAGRWYRIETQVTMNSAMSKKDGVLRLWVDGVLVSQDTTARFTDPGWRGIPRWDEWAVGELRKSADSGYMPDLSEGGSIDEWRYWDNIAFSTTRVGLGK